MSNTPRVNLGQSEFQDAFMVVGAEDAPYRRLRKIELHINELNDALKHNDFEIRKAKVKLKRLDKNDELEAIEAEEIEYGLQNSQNLFEDAKRRLANFEEMKKQLIESVPQDYWDAGFENAESDHWVNYYSKRVALEKLSTGAISTSTIEQIMVLPQEMSKQIMIAAPHVEQNYLQITNEADKEVAKIMQLQQDK